ncbi:MAG: response regulator [bacterium]|nr:response regulator [bacterium]
MITPRKIKVLVVDDEKVVRDVLTRFLNLKGIEVKTVEDGLQVVEIVKQEEFDLVFAEIKMCKKGGLEVFREVKKLMPEIKFIITTAYAPQEMLEQAKQEGVIVCIKKPFDFEEIVMILKELHLL